MPLNKLENFIKNTDGRTIYVNPADLNATDSISNQGTSLTEPFRTIQRALIESARFSYVRGNDNDLIERTTIILYPGEHVIDNRPGFGIKEIAGNTVAVRPDGSPADPFASFNLTDDSNFDIDSANNILHRYNSIYGGVIVPRGTSIVGMDLRKTKIRPKYVPNPTDPSVPDSAIFRITGTCYFWQFTIFDGDDTGLVFTDNKDFSENNRSVPTFSHNKLTAFEYADGVNQAIANGFELTDLEMYYAKLSRAYNEASGRPIDEQYPQDSEGFAPQRPEFEIVGAFATDPVRIARIISGDGFTPDAVITVDTTVPHNLSVGTPIKIRGVAIDDYNVSTKVASILGPQRFTYSLARVRPNLPAEPSVSNATVTVETDTVTGASPYIFNVSMRSVWGVNGMHADGAKATGFRSMVVAQFTAISLQKDDRAFVKYNDKARRYDGISIPTVRGADLSALSSSTNTATVYHLDPRAVYRPGWDTTHIKMSNDAVIQIVSVFAIGFNQHFAALGGADASITNSNSNFGQFALFAEGFKNDAFRKDDQGFISSIITPNNAFNPETNQPEIVDYVNIDFDLTRTVAQPNHLYLLGYTNPEDKPPAITQGYRIGSNYSEQLKQPISTSGPVPTAEIRMVDVTINASNAIASGSFVGRKVYDVLSGPVNSTLTLPPHGLLNGESIRIFSAIGDLPENVERGQLYYANVVDGETIRLSTSESNAFNNIFLEIYGGAELRIESRVNDKEAGDRGHPLQYDSRSSVGNWYIHTDFNSGIYQYLNIGDGRAGEAGENDGDDFVSTFSRNADNRSLDDKLYRVRYVIPKESSNAKPPTPGYVIQQSSSTGARNNDDFSLDEITINDYEYNRNPRFLFNARKAASSPEIIVDTELPHQLSIGDKVRIINVESTLNPDAVDGRSYNGEFLVTRIDNARQFRYSTTDVNGFTRELVDEVGTPDTFSNDTNDRNILLPRFQRKDNQINAFVYRVEEIIPFSEGIRDGIYHLFCVNSGNQVTETFQDRNYNQPIEDLYPQLDIDNLRQNPPATVTFANRSPLGRVTIDEQQNSMTRETIDRIYKANNRGIVSEVTNSPVGAGFTFVSEIELDREHTFNGVYSYASLDGGNGYSDGTFYNVKLFSNFGAFWKGASAKIVVVAGTVSSLEITDPGSGYAPGETLFVDPAITNTSGASITLDVNSVEENKFTIIQFTGGGSVNPDVYSFIKSSSSVTDDFSRKIEVVRTENDGEIVEGMYPYPTDSGTEISSSSYNNLTGETTFNSANNAGFGLQRGQSFVVFSNIGSYLGKFYVKELVTPTQLTAITQKNLGDVLFVGKAGYEDNDASTGATGENVGIRGTELFGLGTFYLEDAIDSSDTVINVRAKDGGTSGDIPEKLFLGRYIKIGNEIMRVASKDVSGPLQNQVTVIRGALGTNVAAQQANSKIRAIEPQPIELRRPSILRASGHTFEYLGYGPGNYSTSLPQLQVRQLPDDEVYLVQAQELSCGQVVYTGMSDNGDFYIGNTKYSATSGTQTTFDVPIPTVAGQLASSNSVVFDEVIINRRLFVAGGETNEVLSQFDGPVKFTQNVTIQSRLSVSGEASLANVVINSTTNSTSPDNGALVVRGGAGIAQDLYVGGTIDVANLTVDNDLSVGNDINVIGGDVILSADAAVRSNNYLASLGNRTMNLFTNQTSGDIEIGSAGTNRDVSFNTTKPGTGEGGDDIASADAGVVIDGGLVVRDVVIAKEFRGDGLGGGPGTIIMWAGSTSAPPKNFLICNGATVSRNTYPKLFDAIGYQYGGSGNNFRLPDLRDRFIVGSGSSYNNGATGGRNQVALDNSNLPRHFHNISETDITHGHPLNLGSQQADAAHDHTGGSGNAGGHRHNAVNFNQNGDHQHNLSINQNGGHKHNGSSGGGGQHDHNASSSEGGRHRHTTTDDGSHNHNYERNSGRGGTGSETAGERESKETSRDGNHNHELSEHNGHSHPVNVSNAPNHTHSLGNMNTQPDHSHGGETNTTGTHGHSFNLTQQPGHDHNVSISTDNATHNHTITGNLQTNTTTHRHNIGQSGQEQAFDIRPRYFALAYVIQYK